MAQTNPLGNNPESQAERMELPRLGNQRDRQTPKSFKDISHYFLSAAEADESHHAAETAGHLTESSISPPSDNKPTSPKSSGQSARRKENCASCAHLIARAGQPFQCRIFSQQHAKHRVERRDTIDLNEGRTCPYFMRVTSKQIEDILKSHGSSLSSEQVREYAHRVDEQVLLNKTITVIPQAGVSAEEALREELLRYLIDGYSIIEATVSTKEESSENKHSKTVIRKITLRVEQEH